MKKQKTVDTTVLQRERLSPNWEERFPGLLPLTNEKVLNQAKGFYGHWDHTEMWASRELT